MCGLAPRARGRGPTKHCATTTTTKTTTTTQHELTLSSPALPVGALALKLCIYIIIIIITTYFYRYFYIIIYLHIKSGAIVKHPNLAIRCVPEGIPCGTSTLEGISSKGFKRSKLSTAILHPHGAKGHQTKESLLTFQWPKGTTEARLGW